MRMLWTGIGAGLCVAAASGCTPNAVLGATTYHQDNAYQLDGAGLRSLLLHIPDGNVAITGTDDTTVHVQEHLSYAKNDKPKPRHAIRANTLTLGFSCPKSEARCSIDYTVRVPRTLALDLRDDAGNLTVGGWTGALQARTAAGNINLAGLAAPDVTVSTTGGNVRAVFTAPPTSADLSSTAGNVHVTLPKSGGYAVDADTTVGNKSISVPVDANSGHRVHVSTTAGNVTVD